MVSAKVCRCNLHVLMVFLYDWNQLISMYKSLTLDYCTIPSESRLILLNDTVHFPCSEKPGSQKVI